MSHDFYKTYIDPYSPIIVKICRTYTNSQEDFEDYYQEVCLQIWRSKDNFQQKSKLSTWIYRLSLNVCLSLHSKEKNFTKKHSEYKPINISSDNGAFKNESLNLLYRAIKKLSEVDRAIIVLYLEEKSNIEIAEITGTNANNIGVRISRIKDKLKKMLDGQIN
ncbi:MAG: sigma-70 family RNA polymerase sigma factor [Bacteroidota bacterium]